MDYTYKRLLQITNDAKRKAKTGNLRPEEAAIAAAAAYATDLVDIAKAAGDILDLTIMNEDVITKCLISAHMSNMNQGKTIDESRENLIKLLGGYELFAVTNFCNIEDKEVELVVVRNVMSPEIKLVIESLHDKEGKKIRFDVYDLARQTVSEFELQDANGFSIGRMLTFHNRLIKEFLSKLYPDENWYIQDAHGGTIPI